MLKKEDEASSFTAAAPAETVRATQGCKIDRRSLLRQVADSVRPGRELVWQSAVMDAV